MVSGDRGQVLRSSGPRRVEEAFRRVAPSMRLFASEEWDPTATHVAPLEVLSVLLVKVDLNPD